jgi:hypothetical protein
VEKSSINITLAISICCGIKRINNLKRYFADQLEVYMKVVNTVPNVIVREKSYKHYGNCVELSNGIIDLVITIETGPRIIRYGFVGKQNEFCDNAPLALRIDKDEWQLRGGHRLWHSPEAFPRTYFPDNDLVEWEKIDNGIKIICNVQPWVQIKKEMDIILSQTDSHVSILHRLINKNAWPVELAIWALTVMAPGGIGIIPIPQEKAHFSEGAKGIKTVSIWSYTQMNDPRIRWGQKYITISQDISNNTNLKIGTLNKDGWIAYINRNNIFVKKFSFSQEGSYPDGGVNCEIYGCDFMLEIESLSPLVLLQPDKEITHVEEWSLVENIENSIDSENQIDEIYHEYIDNL